MRCLTVDLYFALIVCCCLLTIRKSLGHGERVEGGKNVKVRKQHQ